MTVTQLNAILNASSSFSCCQPLSGRLLLFFGPEAMSGAADEDVFQRRLADGDGLNLTGEGFDHVGNEAVSLILLEANIAVIENRGFGSVTLADPNGQLFRIVARFKQKHVATDFVFQFCRSAQRDQLAFAEDCQAIATLGFFHQVRGHDHGDMFLVAKDGEILPEIATRARIEAGRGLIEQKHRRVMQAVPWRVRGGAACLRRTFRRVHWRDRRVRRGRAFPSRARRGRHHAFRRDGQRAAGSRRRRAFTSMLGA